MNKKEAGAFLDIDLGAVVSNWRNLSSLLPSSGKCAAVVKSNAYGLGASQISSALSRGGCRDFFVAYLSEGIEIRRAVGANARIFVLHGTFPDTEKDFTAYNLIPVLNTFEQIDRWIAYTASAGHRFPAALNFDTGMSRFALSAKEQDTLFSAAEEKLKNLDVVLLMSHLVNADNPKDEKNQTQLAWFKNIVAKASAILGYTPELSLSATAGIFLGKDYLFDLCRPGLGLYGLYPHSGCEKTVSLQPALSLKAKILQIQSAHAGQSVGYGASYSFTKDGRIATVGIGYADGFLRNLGNRGYGCIAGKKVPIIGRISMDLTTFDVTDIPESELFVGQMIEIIGPNNSLDTLASSAETISYELLCNLGGRYCRQYVNEVLPLSLSGNDAADKADISGVS
ncbi:MAG: alanine racemase [Alphaproteobacteria bacterium]|nr:alanine racemase [Alphaproteobacteria bacterium]